MIGQGEFCPAQLGATTLALRWIIEEFGLESFGPGDVYIHNDPYSGMNHLPEHMVVKAVFYEGAARRHRRLHRPHGRGRRHRARRLPRRRARGVPGGPADPAGQDRQGAASRTRSSSRLILANNRTPRVIGRRHPRDDRVAERRRAPAPGAGRPARRRALHARSRRRSRRYSERRMRAAIGELPNGTYVARRVHHRQRRLARRAGARAGRDDRRGRPRGRRLHGLATRSGRARATARWSPRSRPSTTRSCT